MPYIGKEPVAGNFVLLDSITTSATATYALTKDSVAYSPESARNMIVSLNGVTQAPEAAFTVSGSNITFSSALTASDVIDYILVLGDVLSVGTPSDGTVGTSQMSYPLGNFSSTGIDDNATSTAITIDASENVGIGTASPSSKLSLLSSGVHGLHLEQQSDNNSNSARIFFDNSTNIWTAYSTLGSFKIASGATIGTTSGTDRLVIDSSGNVGIGTASPSYALDVVGNIRATNSSGSTIIVNRTSNPGSVELQYNGTQTAQFSALSGGGIATYVGSTPSEAMRIDSSGNLLVGTTVLTDVSSSGTGNEGAYIKSVGQLGLASSNDPSLIINRKTTDGDIALFRKDGTAVGSIGSEGGNTIYIVNGDTGLRFAGGSDVIVPSGANGAVRDGAIDLGLDSQRFKDLYLSGGAYLGGTGAANHLDDYEEGTWTPALSGYTGTTYGTQSGFYTKVGRLVTLHFLITISSIGTFSSNARITGLPFAAGTNTALPSQPGSLSALNATRDDQYFDIYATSSDLYLYSNGGTPYNGNSWQAGTIGGTYTYFTS